MPSPYRTENQDEDEECWDNSFSGERQMLWAVLLLRAVLNFVSRGKPGILCLGTWANWDLLLFDGSWRTSSTQVTQVTRIRKVLPQHSFQQFVISRLKLPGQFWELLISTFHFFPKFVFSQEASWTRACISQQVSSIARGPCWIVQKIKQRKRDRRRWIAKKWRQQLARASNAASLVLRSLPLVLTIWLKSLNKKKQNTDPNTMKNVDLNISFHAIADVYILNYITSWLVLPSDIIIIHHLLRLHHALGFGCCRAGVQTFSSGYAAAAMMQLLKAMGVHGDGEFSYQWSCAVLGHTTISIWILFPGFANHSSSLSTVDLLH